MSIPLQKIQEWNIVNKNIPLQNAVTQNDLSRLIVNWKTSSLHTFDFNHQIEPEAKVTNQKSSGRCWMFAGLNVLRINFMKKHNLPKDFEFSQTHLFFYDKLERANTFLNQIIANKDKDINDRYIQHLLEGPLGDGGYWHTFANLVNKYGLVPKTVHPETVHSSATARMNFVLDFQLRQYAKQLREADDNLDELKNKCLEEYHRLLCLFLGTPVSYFDWKYTDKEGKYQMKEALTPKEFYKMGDWDVNDFITLTNDPRNSYDTKMKMDFIGNIHGTNDVVYYNTTMDELIKWSKKSIMESVPVWHGCDVRKWLDVNKDMMDLDIVNYNDLLGVKFNLNKKERMEYGISSPTHAMTFVGFESKDDTKEMLKWKVENSWSSIGPNSGYYGMSHAWFKEYVYEVVIPKWVMDKDTLEKIEKCEKVVELPAWDIMGNRLD